MNISGKAKLAGVLGCPIAHSLSPKLHNYWLNKYNIDGVYIPIEVTEENFKEVFKTLPKMGFRGVNITVPHKVKAFELVDEVSTSAQKIGAVNTVIFDENGYSYGTNTDCYGFLMNIESKFEGLCSKSPVVVYGAGGAARAVVSALVDAGCPEIRLVNRTKAKADFLAEQIGGNIKVELWAKRSFVIKGAGLIVNTTTLGLEKGTELPVDLADLSPDAIVTDIIYNPLKTNFLRRAAVRGNRIIDGLGMLLHQAVPAFEAWFGTRPIVDEDLRSFILDK